MSDTTTESEKQLSVAALRDELIEMIRNEREAVPARQNLLTGTFLGISLMVACLDDSDAQIAAAMMSAMGVIAQVKVAARECAVWPVDDGTDQ